MSLRGSRVLGQARRGLGSSALVARRSIALFLGLVILAPGSWVDPTRVDASDGPALLAAGDIATCGQYGHEATAVVLDGQQGVVAALGDLAYPAGTEAEFRDCYGPSWGRHLARTRPTPGNHEYQTAGAAPYYQYFGVAAGDPTKGYYSYDLGTWHVVVLNSNCSAVQGCHAGSPQEQWLRADLAANPEQCTVAYFHHPRFSSGNHGGEALMGPFWQALWEAGADVVLSGHDHIYERFAPQAYNGAADPSFGIRQFTVGTGGRNSDRFVRQPTVANSEVTETATFGVLRLELDAGSYTWRFLPEADRTFADTGTGSCHGAPTGPPPTETTPPTVTSRTPGVDATNVPVGTTVTATFDEPVTGVSGTTFTLEGPGATPVTATVSYDGSSRTATLDPSTTLADATTYTARLTSGITDTSPNANPLVPLTWSFTTAAAPPSSGIVLRAVSSGDNLTATSLVLARPGNIVEGDVMLAAVAARGTPTITSPAGWTLVRVDANGSTVRQAIFCRIAGLGEPASYTFGLSTSQSAAGGIVAYAGVDPAAPIDAASGQVNASSTLITAPSVTTSGPDRMLVGFTAMATLTSATPPAGMIERYDEASPTTNTYKITAGGADQLVPTAGATGPRVTTAAHSSTSVGQLVALRPGGPPGPSPTPTPSPTPSPGPTPTPTPDPTPTPTPGPTPTPTPGPTPTPTPGPTPTPTPGPTPTPTPAPTPTPTPTPSTLTFNSVADARVEERRPSGNFGTSSYVRTDGGSDPDVESYLRFAITGISGQIQSAKLRLFVSSGTVDGPAAYATTSGWTERGITWSNRPARTSGALADRGSISSGSWVEYDVTAAVGGNGDVSVVLATTSSDGADFRSREYTTTTQRPQLVVTVQP